MREENDSKVIMEIIISFINLGQIEVVSELLETLDSNVDLNVEDPNGKLAVTTAAARNDFKMLKLLVDFGARVDLKDYSGKTVGWWAAKHANSEMKDFIEREEEKINLTMSPPIKSL